MALRRGCPRPLRPRARRGRALSELRFGLPGTPGLELVEREGRFTIAFPGAPEALRGRLEPLEGDRFRVETGALAGREIALTRDAHGTVTHLALGDAIRFPRHPEADPPSFQLAPERPPEPDRDAAFAALWERARAAGPGAAIPYALAQPRHELLDWLCATQGVLLHGSNDPGIERFEPRAQSLGPTLQRSQLAVAACADGLWAMAYAILDRRRMRGSFHNGVLELGAGDRRTRVYHFSIHEGLLEREPSILRAGSVYVLDAADFEPVRDGPLGRFSLEYACPRPLRALARLDVGPADFPLRFRGHDDSRVLTALDQLDRLYRESRALRALDDGCELHVPARAGLADDLERAARIYRAFYPWSRAEWEIASGGAGVLRVRGSSGLHARIELARTRALREPS